MYGFSLPTKQLRELYQKLDVTILSASFHEFFEGGTSEAGGLRISLNVSIRNPRPVDVTIQKFKPVTKLNGKDYVAHAKDGEIRAGEVLDWDNEMECTLTYKSEG